tara:strand:- start:20277 stop:21407 length:1131 start_codon:yes stop_codon:yes gene_type:complete
MELKETQKKRIYAIMHVPPPIHGASKVGEFIRDNERINQSLNIIYSPIKIAKNIEDIGRFSFNKLFFSFAHLIRITLDLFKYKPDFIYFTASPGGFAFYRDCLFMIPIRAYSRFYKKKYYLHFHAKGIKKFILKSFLNKLLGRLLFSRANLILLDKSLCSEYIDFIDLSKINYLPNCVEDPFKEKQFEEYIEEKFKNKNEDISFLYLANMIESKGYKKILDFAACQRNHNYKFNFAGAWDSEKTESYFFSFLDSENLLDLVKYHGVVAGEEKRKLFESADIFLFPTNYHRESFPLCVIEALSYGVPVISTKVGAIPNMLTPQVGIVMESAEDTNYYLDEINEYLIDFKTALQARKHYLENFSTAEFERRFVRLFRD